MRPLLSGVLAIMATILASCTAPVENDTRELIVLIAPNSDDKYYAPMRENIMKFQVDFAKTIAQHDDVIILADEADFAEYSQVLDAKHVAIATMADIWARDFGLINPHAPKMFLYSSAGQGGGINGEAEAYAVQEYLTELTHSANLKYENVELINDGGNWVEDYAGNVVISRKFLVDNQLSESNAKAILRTETGAVNIAFIDADEEGGLEHADGIVSFIDENSLMINTYDEYPEYAAKLKSDLRAGLPNVKITEIVTPYIGSEIYDSRFGSACGLYTNALVTPHRIYFPQFGIPEDAIALAQIRAATNREVIPIDSAKVCEMGGGVRCMSWQLRGEKATNLAAYLRQK